MVEPAIKLPVATVSWHSVPTKNQNSLQGACFYSRLLMMIAIQNINDRDNHGVSHRLVAVVFTGRKAPFF